MQAHEKRVEISNHSEELSWAWVRSSPGKSFEEVSSICHLISSVDALTHALNWAWLSWHAVPEFDQISDCVTWFALRAAGGIKDPKDRRADWRGMHDWILMVAAILTGNVDTMQAAAQAVRGASVRSKGNQYRESLGGILRARVLQEKKEEERQLSIFRKSKADGYFASVSIGLLNAFVQHDSAALNKAVREGVMRHWSDPWLGRVPRREPIVVAETAKQLTLNLRKKDSRFYWAWPEAAFAKLAILSDSAEIEQDDFWLPKAFLGMMRSEAPPVSPIAASVRISVPYERPVNFFANRRKSDGT